MERTIAKSGEKGLAQVSIGKGRVEVVFENEKRFKISTDSVPEFMLGEKFPTSGKFWVKLGRDNDEIQSISPVEGNYQIKFFKFSARKDEDPVPQKQKSSYNDSYYFTFMPIHRITRGTLKGCEIAVFLPYRFAEVDGGEVVLVGSDKDNATAVHRLEQWIEATGLVDKRIKYTDNLLPKFQKLALELDKEFNVSLRNGKVEYFAPIPQSDEDDARERKLAQGDDEVTKPRAKAEAKVEDDWEEGD